MIETFTEWRVTGGFEGEPYEFTWSPFRNPHLGDSEEGARSFVALTTERSWWTDGPHLTKRTVTVTGWEPA